jgi:hypothetical protein
MPHFLSFGLPVETRYGLKRGGHLRHWYATFIDKSFNLPWTEINKAFPLRYWRFL